MEKVPTLYTLCHLIPLTQCSKEIVRPLTPGGRPKPGLPNTDKIQPVGTFHSGHCHPLPCQSPGVSPGPRWRRGGRALEVCPGLAERRRSLPDCVSRPGQLPFPPTVSRDTLDSGVEGKVSRQCLPWGPVWESRQRKVIGGTSLAVQWLKF